MGAGVVSPELTPESTAPREYLEKEREDRDAHD